MWGWLARIDRGLSPVAETETLEPEPRARERLFVGLRLGDGIDRNVFQQQTGFVLDQLAADAIQKNVTTGLLIDDGRTIRLSRAGRFLADRVVQDFL